MSEMKLYQHQKEALEQTEGRNRVAYFYDMGLGKTFIGSEKMRQLAANTNLIICQKSKIQDWKQHFMDNYPLIYIYNLTDKKSFEMWLKDQQTGWYQPSVAIINYELAWRRPELLKIRHFTLMLDESSLIQNASAKQTKFILKLQPDNVILLSGTPCSGKYENLWTQAHLLGWEIPKRTYEQQYVNWTTLNLGRAKVRIVDKKNPYKNVERLKQKLRENGALFKKTEEVLDLPEQTYVTITCEPVAAYKTLLKDKIVTLEGKDLVADTRLTEHLYTRMVCGQYNPNKLQALKDLIESTKDRLVIFYNFNAEIEKIKSVCQDRPLSIINGSIKDLAAYEAESDSITLVQYQAGAKGLNLQKANKVIYFTPTERCEDWMQSAKRIHRIGQKNACIYYKLVTMRTIEEGIYKALERGEDYTDELFRKETEDEREKGNRTRNPQHRTRNPQHGNVAILPRNERHMGPR